MPQQKSTPSKRVPTFTLTDHVCRECSGRILRMSNPGVTAGGNGIYQCAECGCSSSGLGPRCICWCGMRLRGQDAEQYVCVSMESADTDEAIRIALEQCGFMSSDVRRRPKQQVAVVMRSLIEEARCKLAEARQGSCVQSPSNLDAIK